MSTVTELLNPTSALSTFIPDRTSLLTTLPVFSTSDPPASVPYSSSSPDPHFVSSDLPVTSGSTSRADMTSRDSIDTTLVSSTNTPTQPPTDSSTQSDEATTEPILLQTFTTESFLLISEHSVTSSSSVSLGDTSQSLSSTSGLTDQSLTSTPESSTNSSIHDYISTTGKWNRC